MTIRPAEEHLTVYKGATFNDEFQLVQADEVTPIPLTGKTLRLEARTYPDAPSPAFVLDVANAGIIITDVNLGKFTINLSALTTAAMNDSLFYHLELIQGAVEDRYMFGKFILVK